MSLLGMWLDKLSGSEEDIATANPEAMVIGFGAWGDIPSIQLRAPALKWVSLRDTRKPLIQRNPEQVANEQCDYIQGLRQWSSIPDSVLLLAHGLDEEHGDWKKALDWELRHLRQVHARGERGCHWNIAFGNYNDAEALRFEQLWAEADYLGPHAYLGWDSELRQEAPREETCFRYRKWTGFPRHKCILTETSFDDWDGTYSGEGKPGWRNLGLTEDHVKWAILNVAREWHKDGLAGAIFYAKNTQNSEWASFYSTRAQDIAWRDGLPPLRLHGGNMANSKELFEAIEKLGLDGHILLNAGKAAVDTYHQRGDQIGATGEGSFDLFSQIINKAREGKALSRASLTTASASTSPTSPES